jgi:hypothetical protein
MNKKYYTKCLNHPKSINISWTDNIDECPLCLAEDKKRAKLASWDTIKAIFLDWLEKFEWFDATGKSVEEISDSLCDILHKCEKDGYLVVLRQDTCCRHCGASWPRKDGDPHITICSKCLAKQERFRAESFAEAYDYLKQKKECKK